jgi:hypothetical protein
VGPAPGQTADPPAACALRRRVRTLRGPPERRHGLRLLSLDVFDDGVCVHLHLAREGRADGGGFAALPDEVGSGAIPYETHRPPMLRLEDDRGTPYRWIPQGAGWSSELHHRDGPFARVFTSVHAGMVPPDATVLRLASDRTAFELPL